MRDARGMPNASRKARISSNHKSKGSAQGKTVFSVDSFSYAAGLRFSGLDSRCSRMDEFWWVRPDTCKPSNMFPTSAQVLILSSHQF